MSTAANHRKRSHKSHFRTRAFNGGRRSVIKPTLNKSMSAQIMRKLAKLMGKLKGES